MTIEIDGITYEVAKKITVEDHAANGRTNLVKHMEEHKQVAQLYVHRPPRSQDVPSNRVCGSDSVHAVLDSGCLGGLMAEKNKAAQELGRLGGLARAGNLTKDQRSEAARKAVKARWAKKKGK